jgi:hypothetical protein
LTQFRACVRSDKSIFPNQMEITISAQSVIFPKLKGDDFSGAPEQPWSWKSIFPDLKEIAFLSKGGSPEPERGLFFRAPE